MTINKGFVWKKTQVINIIGVLIMGAMINNCRVGSHLYLMP